MRVKVGSSVKEVDDGGKIAHNADFQAYLRVSGKKINLEPSDESTKYYSKFFNLTDDLSYTQARGTWELYIKSTEDAILDEFTIIATIPLNPLDNDYDNDGISDGSELSAENGYITDPTRKDTDGDGWSDYKEIYELPNPTNPLSRDTDGDGVRDNIDKDPLRDLYIKVSIKKISFN